MANGTLAASQLEMLSQSGTGIITITPPATNTNRAITLPDAAGAIVVSGTTPSLNGIAFPATQVASANANTLDDYEEGTWTPVVADATTGGNVGSGEFFGTYTKVGRIVTVQIGLANINTTGLTSGNSLICRGLPFVTLNGSTDSYSAVFADRINFTNYIVAGTLTNSSNIRFYDIIDSAVDETLKVSAITASTGSDIYFSITYFV